MPSQPTSLALLGLAEELSGAQVSLGDEAAEALVHHHLDRVLDAVVDLSQGREHLSRVLPPPEVTAGPADLASADLASCSALAAQCQQLAARLDQGGADELARLVSQSLRHLAAALQDVVQGLPHEAQPVVRQRLLRSVRGATAMLAPAAP